MIQQITNLDLILSKMYSDVIYINDFDLHYRFNLAFEAG